MSAYCIKTRCVLLWFHICPMMSPWFFHSSLLPRSSEHLQPPLNRRSGPSPSTAWCPWRHWRQPLTLHSAVAKTEKKNREKSKEIKWDKYHLISKGLPKNSFWIWSCFIVFHLIFSLSLRLPSYIFYVDFRMTSLVLSSGIQYKMALFGTGKEMFAHGHGTNTSRATLCYLYISWWYVCWDWESLLAATVRMQTCSGRSASHDWSQWWCSCHRTGSSPQHTPCCRPNGSER